eukprot:Protomagalhaensia_sp_Gyna_25__1315@NODE_165_length_4702_cov_205_856959_g128_i0_p3_GENE_NODE_165_length_4702_cov_205_856959_g128_i0NODE_165_length_4702_cov_205_856959_g128_i0_p3_ORF_typecomplete_len275_score20_70COPI_assoc/PF08507_10/9_8e06DUF3278/PF11683_8/6_1e02DUF3278/PF11683_8/0_16UPF0139/PF03669_13/0_25UPF0139/PF03669_13/2_6e03DUF2304/PF10066_9/9_6e02DUF2304/PF10066_9/0_13DUF2304/PF10066_9/1_2e04SdpI/PF13630_6/1_4SdpI/PF13630_6/1_3e02DUF485/PF04341_12/2_1e03DUF485/PF04341_12/0_12_NODE_165_le
MYDTDYTPNPAAEQQQELLIQGRFQQPPTSVGHLADRMEAGGARVEETLSRLNCKYTTLFFIAGWVTILTSIVSFLNAVANLSLVGIVQSVFLQVFGFIMMVLDIPGAPEWASRYRTLVRRHIRFLTRLTGKSIWFLYLGSMIAVCMWPTHNSRRSGFFMFFGLCMSFFVIAVSVIGLSIALRKSLRLEKIRKQVQNSYKGNASEVYRKYAITDPTHGMQFGEMNRLCADYSQGRFQFDVVDLAIIYNALDDHQKSAINEREFTEWVSGTMTFL